MRSYVLVLNVFYFPERMKEKLIRDLNARFNKEQPEKAITFFIEKYRGRIAFATNLGAEDQVLTQMVAAIDPTIKIFTLDTGRLFQESYELLQRTNEKYGIKIQVFFPDAKQVESMVNNKGINLFYESVENRKLCCYIRKIEPLNRALEGKEIWITGLRSEQTVSRYNIKLVEWDEPNGLIKVNPLVHWTEKQVWDYIRENKIPYNPLHDKGFPSIGCQPCTRAIQPGEDSRAGRWWWEKTENKECGIHKRYVKKIITN